jgi:hypothetical protein
MPLSREDEELLRVACPALYRSADTFEEEGSMLDAAVLRFAAALIEQNHNHHLEPCPTAEESDAAALKVDLAELALHRALSTNSHGGEVRHFRERFNEIEKAMGLRR